MANSKVSLLERALFLILSALPALWGSPALCQASQQQTGSGGMATAGIFKPVYDSAHRSITAGGTVKTGPTIFMNVSKQAGLNTWHHTAGNRDKRLIIEAKGSGVALLDYDNDGWLDIYLVKGSTSKALDHKEAASVLAFLE